MNWWKRFIAHATAPTDHISMLGWEPPMIDAAYKARLERAVRTLIEQERSKEPKNHVDV